MIPPPVGTVDAIEAAIAASDSVEIVFPAGVTNIDRPIGLPNSKHISIRGEHGASALFTSTTPGDSPFRLTQDPNPDKVWSGSIAIRGLEIETKRNAPNQSCIDSAPGVKVNHEKLVIEDLKMYSTGYNINLWNMGYTIAPQFRNLRGNNGIYWGGAIHSASNLLIEDCRFINSKRGPAIVIQGARKWTVRSNITEGGEPWDADVNPDATDVLRTRGLLVVNPGPENGLIESHWCEYWAGSSPGFNITVAYNYNNGGANKPSDITVANTSLKLFQVLNTSTTDAFAVHAYSAGEDLPNFSDESQFKATGKVHFIINGGELDRDYRFDNPKIKINSATIVKPGFKASHYRDVATLLYAYRGGTGVYASGASPGDWSQCRPYVQHHPKAGHSIVFRAITKLNGTAFVAKMPGSLLTGELSQELWACCPHLPATIKGGAFGAGMIGTMGNRFDFDPGHAPKRYVGGGEERDSPPFFRAVSADAASGKWLQIFTSAAWRGGFGDSPAIAENYDCYEWPNEPGPPLGTSIVGDVCRSAASAWQCTESGTSRPIQVTGNAVKGVAAITGLSDITELLVGDFLDIAGATGVYRILDIVGDVVTLDKKITSSANLTAAIVTNHAPTWTAKP